MQTKNRAARHELEKKQKKTIRDGESEILWLFVETHPDLLRGVQGQRFDQAKVEGGGEDEDEHRGGG